MQKPAPAAEPAAPPVIEARHEPPPVMPALANAVPATPETVRPAVSEARAEVPPAGASVMQKRVPAGWHFPSSDSIPAVSIMAPEPKLPKDLATRLDRATAHKAAVERRKEGKEPPPAADAKAKPAKDKQAKNTHTKKKQAGRNRKSRARRSSSRASVWSRKRVPVFGKDHAQGLSPRAPGAPMFTAVLIANRGEIACRIMRTAKRLGLRTIAVYSQADAHALHVKRADEAIDIGPAPAAESYLAGDKLIAAARAAGADCIHPGYGFLSENAGFAQSCRDAGIAFIGPSPEAIRAMGLKDRAKALMEEAGVPVVPGYHGERQEPAFLKRKAYEIGYPVLIKAVAGGGGKGMRRVERHADFDDALASCLREAKAAFGDARVLIEKYVSAPRHIEFQVFGDRHGNVIHLGERDCSLQRRHQKVIEEAPAPGMSADFARGHGQGRGRRRPGGPIPGRRHHRVHRRRRRRSQSRRLLVHGDEHAAAGRASGDRKRHRPRSGRMAVPRRRRRDAAAQAGPGAARRSRGGGAALCGRSRARLPAVHRQADRAALSASDGLRVDSGVEAGDAVTPFYDPMIAKLIAHGATRDEALDRLADALEATVVAGPRSNAGFLAALARADAFRGGDFDTGFIDAHLAALGASPQGLDRAAAACGTRALLAREQARLAATRDPEAPASPWDAHDGFQLSGARRLALPIVADGESVVAEIDYGPAGAAISVEGEGPADEAVAIAEADAVYVLRRGRQTKVTLRDLALDQAGDAGQGGLMRAPMHGKVLAILVEPGADVTRGQRVAIIEAMKMEHTLVSPIDGTVAEIAVSADAQVAEGARIMLIEAAPPQP